MSALNLPYLRGGSSNPPKVGSQNLGVMDLFEKFETFGIQARPRLSTTEIAQQPKPDPWQDDQSQADETQTSIEFKHSAPPQVEDQCSDTEPISYRATSPNSKWTWTASGKIKALYSSLKVPSKIKPHLDNIEVFNWFFTTFTNYVSNFNYKYPGTTFFAFYPVPDNLIEIIGTNELLFDMESNGVVMCYL